MVAVWPTLRTMCSTFADVNPGRARGQGVGARLDGREAIAASLVGGGGERPARGTAGFNGSPRYHRARIVLDDSCYGTLLFLS